MRGNILVIDDDTKVFDKLDENLKAHNVYHTEKIKGARGLIKRKSIDLAIIDLNLCEDQSAKKGSSKKDLRLSGLDFIHTVRKDFPHLAILAISQYRDVDKIRTATQNGADDYIWKGSWLPKRKRFRDKIGELINQKKKRDLKRESIRKDILGESPYTESLRKKLESLAATKESFFLLGEPGLKKEDIIDFLCYTSSFYSHLRSYERVNCSHIDEQDLRKVLESRPKRKKSRSSIKELNENGVEMPIEEEPENPLAKIFQKAHKNICLVNHLGSLSLDLQRAFLEVIHRKKYLDGKEGFFTQLVFCIEGEPEKLIEAGKLLPELYALLQSVKIRPLRDRIQDLHQIIPDWLQRNELKASQLPEEIFRKFMEYDYPQNLVELDKLLQETLNNHKALYPKNSQWKQKEITLSSLPPELSTASLKLSNMHLEVAKVYLDHIDKALQQFNGNKGKAAEALGITSGADNLKKSYVEKYWNKFPELVLQYPTIVKAYKLHM